MQKQPCKFCAALRQVRVLMLASLGSVIFGVVLSDWLRPMSHDLAVLVACLGFSAGSIALWQYVGAIKRFEEIKRSQDHDH